MPLTAIGYAVPPQGLAMLADPAEDVPFGSRKDAMSLDVVRPKDVPRGRVRYEKDYQQSLACDDIAGARPEYMLRSLHLDGAPPKEPIKDSTPRTYRELKKAKDMSLSTHDVDGAQSKVQIFTTTRNTNPLTPRYNLQSTERTEAPANPMRLHDGTLRESMDFKADSVSRFPLRDYQHNPADGRDIELSQPNIKGRTYVPNREDLKRTLEKSGERILCGKSALPQHPRHALHPEYLVHTKTTHPFYQADVDNPLAPRKVAHVEGSSSRVLHRDNGEPQASLIRADVPGAVPQRFKGHVPVNIYDPPQVTPFSMFTGLTCTDIEGAQTGTRKGGAC
ncbi:unnamed protein product [Durusdinium trenchii]|uniref:Uncharacterized protein n=1 Tax=Durusdinium trenchii TaxID=1381693 RepID=A0ABP0P129_9DINO